MAPSINPIFLFADSQPLFWRCDGRYYLEKLNAILHGVPLQAAYIGASNGDQPEYYEIFVAAMENIGATSYQFIQSEFTENEREFLQSSNLILLAGGDVKLGWSVMQATGMKDILVERYKNGALLLGISAGAVQLGKLGAELICNNGINLFNTLHLVPYLISCHEELNEWRSAKQILTCLEDNIPLLCIPKGAIVEYYPQGNLQQIRGKSFVLVQQNGKISQTDNLLGEKHG